MFCSKVTGVLVNKFPCVSIAFWVSSFFVTYYTLLSSRNGCMALYEQIIFTKLCQRYIVYTLILHTPAKYLLLAKPVQNYWVIDIQMVALLPIRPAKPICHAGWHFQYGNGQLAVGKMYCCKKWKMKNIISVFLNYKNMNWEHFAGIFYKA